MTRTRRTYALFLGVVAAGLVGCAPKMDMETLKEEMNTERPAALDHLDALVGTWKGEFTMKIRGMDEEIKGHGTTKLAWDCDNWVLVEHGEYDMKDLGKMKGIGVWTYDPRCDKFHTFWADSTGARGVGVVEYDPDENEWEFRVKSNYHKGSTTGRGSIQVSGGTMAWDWSEFAFFGLIKVMEAEGKSHKQ